MQAIRFLYSWFFVTGNKINLEDKKMIEFIQNIDWNILHGIHNNLSCGFLDFIMPKISLLGNGGAIWLVTSLGLIISPKYRRYGITMLGAIAAGALVGNVCLKPLIARPRPCWVESVNLLIKNPTDYSFPSGHTLASVIGAAILTFTNKKWGYVAIPLAILIAFSRLYLYVHFPSDILASLILGGIISFIAILVCRT